MRCDAVFKKHVRLTCCDALEQEGFTRFRKEYVDWPFDEDFHGWVGLNTGLYSDHVVISPFVGIHCLSIDKMWNSLKKGRYPGKYSRTTATYARHMGELAPRVPVFHFSLETDVEAEAKRLARLYATVGLTFAKAIANYASLAPLLHQRIDMLGAYPERYACCLYLMGRSEEARTFVKDFLPSHRGYFEGFAIPFLHRLE